MLEKHNEQTSERTTCLFMNRLIGADVCFFVSSSVLISVCHNCGINHCGDAGFGNYISMLGILFIFWHCFEEYCFILPRSSQPSIYRVSCWKDDVMKN